VTSPAPYRVARSGKRVALMISGIAAAVLLVTAIVSVWLVRSGRFQETIRARMVAAIETATGGRAELQAYRFDWRQLRIEVDDFVLHGTEPAGKPPLVRAASLAAGFQIVSLFRRNFDIQYVEIKDPHVYLIVYPDGRTNMPVPKVRRYGETPVQTLLRVAIGRFRLEKGVFEVESRGKTPFAASGRNLAAAFSYELAGPRYLGELRIQPLDLNLGGRRPVPIDIQMAVALEKDRIHITSATWATARASVQFSGSIDDLVSPRGSFQYRATAAWPEIRGALRAGAVPLSGIDGGTVQLAGNALWSGSAGYSITGSLGASGISFRQAAVRLQSFRVDGAFHADQRGVELSRVRLAGETSYEDNSFPVEGAIGALSLRNHEVDFRGLSLALLGGTFEGAATIEGDSRFHLRGEIGGWEARRAVAVYNSRQSLPWNSLISGPIMIQGDLRQKNSLSLSATMNLAPAAPGPPVHGQIAAHYEARTGILDLGASTLILPSSRIQASGAIGRRMRVRLESRDLNDFLPVLGERASSLPLKLENGSLSFNGTVSGKAESPDLAGRLQLARFRYSGEPFDSLEGDLNASPQHVSLENAALARGGARARFRAAIGVDDWQVEPASSLAASGTLRNASVAELLAILHQPMVRATGTLNATGQLAGTVGNPQATGDIEVVKGSWKSQAVDRLAMHVRYAADTVEASSGQLVRGAAQVRFAGSWEHAADRFQTGRLRFEVETNAIPLEQIQLLESARPGLRGSVEMTANGAADFFAAGFRIRDLEADVMGHSLQLAGRGLGDAHLKANTEGSVLRAQLDSNFAGSNVRGQGEWRLEGDYPGSASLTFPRLDLAQLRDWAAPAQSRQPSQFAGFAEGELRVNGPALKPELMKAELRIPNLEIGPGPGFPSVPGGVSLALRNSGPIVATLANSVMTIEAARLVGQSTDLTLAGRVLLDRNNPLDLRGDGRIDLALLHDFNHDVVSSGTVMLDANVRGAWDAPQVSGRLEVQNASASYADFPNGITNANGMVAFAGDRATIQQLTAESGGGKVEFTGFAGYEGKQAIFRLHATAQAMRVRYPAGFSTLASANLNFTGTSDNSMLSGSVTVLRSGINLESDFSSMLAKSAEPVRTPSSRTGFLGGLNLDVEIQTAPDVQVESSLTKSLQADAALRLRGTATNPALIGRINVTQGEVLFFGTKYTINQGTISFYNPVNIEPVLDIDLETKARGIDVTLTVSGPINKLNLTPRSDPPLQFNEIVALLATGRSPTSDPTLLTQPQQSESAQPLQQSTGSALLGQAIANPVSGRLQRFFGISKLRIDPSLPGIEYNPQARLTLEQQVTPDVTFTYITNVTSANPQIVSVEWAASKQWSVVAQREENGVVGLDFFFKKRFK